METLATHFGSDARNAMRTKTTTEITSKTDNGEDDYGDNDEDDYGDNGEDTYDGEDNENLFQFLHTPTGDSPGWDNVVDLVQFAVDIHEAVSRIAEHGDYGTSSESGDDHQQEFSYSWARRGKEKDEATHSLQEEDPEAGPLTEPSPPEGTEESKAPELQTNNGGEEGVGGGGGASKGIEEGEAGTREERGGRVEGREDENEGDLLLDRFPRSETDKDKKNEKRKYWRHKPYRTSFSSFFPLFRFDLPFSNFRLLSLQDPSPLPEE
ncbi:uncharacterized protein LOC119579120 [Penaeus monodon]|uniref:uncharacterized protein LOC119579120 n=1 Tax=Penaeus monodon TaxID=6687 RepID=UPI0018A7B358|nr:uncharacterized protein LOC119579120 [Penaeus monodon]